MNISHWGPCKISKLSHCTSRISKIHLTDERKHHRLPYPTYGLGKWQTTQDQKQNVQNTDRKTQTGRQTDRQTDGWTDRQTRWRPRVRSDTFHNARLKHWSEENKNGEPHNFWSLSTSLWSTPPPLRILPSLSVTIVKTVNHTIWRPWLKGATHAGFN